MTSITKYRNRNDLTGKCSKEGYDAEQQFHSLLADLGANPKAANKHDQFTHIDIHAFSRLKFDVKARKRTHRDGNTQDEFVWVEWDNVRGEKGWLFGEADYIALEREKDFVVVKRDELAALCEMFVDLDASVIEANKALYKVYQRKWRKDRISMIQFQDILDFTDCIILPK